MGLPRHVADNIARFSGRDWVPPMVLDWWERSDRRILLLTGGPGTGKSLLMAWLAGFGPDPDNAPARQALAILRESVKAAHFCQASSRNIAPADFAGNMARQLSANVPGFAEALAATLAERVQIVAQQHNENIAAGASATNVAIAQLNLDGLGDEFSFDRALAQPLKKLQQSHPGTRMLLLVDALDEAQTYTGRPRLADLLSRLGDLPPGVRIVASTRHDPRVQAHLRDAHTIDLISDSPSGIDDVLVYARARLAPRVDLAPADREAFAARLALAAKGVFLYAAVVLDELLARPGSALPDLAALKLPHNLSGLYHEFLVREVGRDEERWSTRYRPLLGLIAVARGDGLSRPQLAAMLGFESDATLDMLRGCSQFLSGKWPDGPFRPFHKSWVDFLLEDEDNLDFHVDAASMHRRIARHFKQGAAQWTELPWARLQQRWDAYAWQHLLHHVAEGLAREEPATELFDLARSDYLAGKQQQLGSMQAVDDDLERVFDTCERDRELGLLAEFAQSKLALQRDTATVQVAGLPALLLAAADGAVQGPLLERWVAAARIIPDLVQRASVLRRLGQAAATQEGTAGRARDLFADAWRDLMNAQPDRDSGYQANELVRAASALGRDGLPLAREIAWRMAAEQGAWNYAAQACAKAGAACVAAGQAEAGLELLQLSLRLSVHTDLFVLNDLLAACDGLPQPALDNLALRTRALKSSTWANAAWAGLLARAGRHGDALAVLEPVFADFAAAQVSTRRDTVWDAALDLSLAADVLAWLDDTGACRTLLRRLTQACAGPIRQDAAPPFAPTEAHQVAENGRQRLASHVIASLVALQGRGMLPGAEVAAAVASVWPAELGEYGCLGDLRTLLERLSHDDASELLDTLEHALPTMRPDASRAELAALLVERRSARCEVEQALEGLRAAPALLTALPDAERPAACASLAVASMRAGRADLAQVQLDDAWSSIERLNLEFDQAPALRAMVRAAPRLSDPEAMATALSRTIEQTRSKLAIEMVAEALGGLPWTAADAGVRAGCARQLEQSVHAPMSGPITMAAMSLAAQAWAAAGQPERARAWLQQAGRQLNRHRDVRSIWEAGTELGQACVALDDVPAFASAVNAALGFQQRWFGLLLLDALARSISSPSAPVAMREALVRGLSTFMATAGPEAPITALAGALAAIEPHQAILGLVEWVDAACAQQPTGTADPYGIDRMSIVNCQAALAVAEHRQGRSNEARLRMQAIADRLLPGFQYKDGTSSGFIMDDLGAALVRIDRADDDWSLTRRMFGGFGAGSAMPANLALGILHGMEALKAGPGNKVLTQLLREWIHQVQPHGNEAMYVQRDKVQALAALAKACEKDDSALAQDAMRESLEIARSIGEPQPLAWAYADLLREGPTGLPARTELEQEIWRDVLPAVPSLSDRSSLAEAWLATSGPGDRQRAPQLARLLSGDRQGDSNLARLLQQLAGSSRWPWPERLMLMLRIAAMHRPETLLLATATAARVQAEQTGAVEPALAAALDRLAPPQHAD